MNPQWPYETSRMPKECSFSSDSTMKLIYGCFSTKTPTVYCNSFSFLVLLLLLRLLHAVSHMMIMIGLLHIDGVDAATAHSTVVIFTNYSIFWNIFSKFEENFAFFFSLTYRVAWGLTIILMVCSRKISEKYQCAGLLSPPQNLLAKETSEIWCSLSSGKNVMGATQGAPIFDVYVRSLDFFLVHAQSSEIID